jgi:hypothetical protein
MRRRTWTSVACVLAALAPSGCFATKGWMRDAYRAREPILLVNVTATARDGGRILQLRLEDESGEVEWSRAFAGHGQTPVPIAQDHVSPGVRVPVVSRSVAPVTTGAMVVVDLPDPDPLIEVRFGDGSSTKFVAPCRFTSALSTFMYALTPFVALLEAAFYPILGPAYLLVTLFAQQTS